MIRTVMEISLLRLWHNKAELLLTFVVPILFFSIFAWIFGARGSRDLPRTKVVVCDEVESLSSQRIVAALHKVDALQIRRPKSSSSESLPTKVSRELAERLVKHGVVAAAIVLTSSSSKSTDVNLAESPSLRIQVLTDSFDQVANKVVAPAVQKAVLVGLSVSSPGPLSEVVSAEHALASGQHERMVSTQLVSHANSLPGQATRVQSISSVPEVEVRDVLGEGKSNPVIAMYAAGIAVMFLLFSATTSSGSLLEERENSTLERLLSSHMTMDHLLLGKWCFLTLLGCLQTTLMFVAGSVFFGLQLREHWDGFAVMTLVTSSAAASFALMLAALCRSRTQLGWVSTVVILSMSALGGSMVPRYLMSEQIRRVGQVTFNAWALDGYNKVFWRELPITELRMEVAVLGSCAFVFLVVARLAASRWDRN